MQNQISDKLKGGHSMARYTGPSWKISRRLGYSILENGKELQKRLMHLDNTDKLVKNP